MGESIFAAGYQDKPYWWEAAPRPDLPPVAPPARADVAIVGSGYTGLTAAIELARGGRQVVVLDSQDAGWGCSTRNGGQVSTSLKPGFEELEALHGRDAAFRIRREGINALEWIGDFIQREQIDCDWERVGRFHAAHNAAAFETLAKAATNQPKGLEVEVFVVPREDQRARSAATVISAASSIPPMPRCIPPNIIRGCWPGRRPPAPRSSATAPCSRSSATARASG